MEHSKLPWEALFYDDGVAEIVEAREEEADTIACLSTSTADNIEANAAFIVKACNAYEGLAEVANLAIGMIVSINKPVTAKRDGPIRIPEKQALLLDKARAALREAGEL